MAHIRLTEQARKEIDAIIDFHERIGSVEFASMFEEALLAKLHPLEHFPRMGRVVPEIGDDAIREVIYRNYRIVYILDEEADGVEVLTIFHSSQQFGPSQT